MTGGESSVLRRLLGRLMGPPETGPWERLFPPGRHEDARSAYFLLHRHPKVDPESFVTETLSRLLVQLPCTTTRTPVEHRHRVRGRVHWSATLKARNSGDCAPTVHVCLEVERRYDTPENQLLKYVLEAIREALSRLPETVREGDVQHPPIRGSDGSATAPRLRAMESELFRHQAHARLRSVTRPDTILPLHLLKAETSKMEEYGLVAELYRRYRAAVLDPGWAGVAELGRGSLILPRRADADGEAWVRLAAEVLRTNLR